MTTKDDPFGLFDQGDRTVVMRPRPGGRDLGGGPLPGDRQPRSGAPLDIRTQDRNPLIRAARPLLAMAPSLKAPRAPGDPTAFRQRLVDELRRLEDRAIGMGADSQNARFAAWAVGALIDDIVLNTPWGAHSQWSTQSLVGTLYHEVDAGERFFDRLAELERQPGRYRDLLELMYCCLLLGFEGRYRIQSGRGSRLADITDGLYRLLARTDAEPELSPHWRGSEIRHKPASTALPMWVVAAGTLLILGFIYLGFNFRLSGYADQIGPLVQALPPAGAVELLRSQPETTEIALPQPPAAPPRLGNPILPEINAFLEPEIRAGLVETGEDPQHVLIRIHNEGLFGSGKANVNPQYVGLLTKVGDALNDEGGRIIVIGHSDNVPIRTARFPSNWELSEARALSVAQLIEDRLTQDREIIVEGRADTQPIASNASAEGRAANRRIEVILFKDQAG